MPCRALMRARVRIARSSKKDSLRLTLQKAPTRVVGLLLLPGTDLASGRQVAYAARSEVPPKTRSAVLQSTSLVLTFGVRFGANTGLP